MSEELNKALVKACEAGNLDQVESYLSQGANINYSRQPFGWTPLTASLFNNKNQAVVSLLLEQRGLDVDLPNSVNMTPLHMACDTENVEAIEKILDLSQASINAKTNSGCTPLMIAASYGKISAVKILLTIPGVDLNTRNHRRKTLEEACKSNPEIYDLIRNAKFRGASRNYSRDDGKLVRNDRNYQRQVTRDFRRDPNVFDKSEFPALKTDSKLEYKENKVPKNEKPTRDVSNTTESNIVTGSPRHFVSKFRADTNASDNSEYAFLRNDREREYKKTEVSKEEKSPKHAYNEPETTAGSLCSACNEDMLSPPRRILQCIKGHHTCGDCRQGMSSCRICGEQFQWRALDMHQFIAKLQKLQC